MQMMQQGASVVQALCELEEVDWPPRRCAQLATMCKCMQP